MGYIHDVEFTGSDYDYEFRESLFEAVEKTKKEFYNEFKSCYSELKKIYDEMEISNGFKGETKRGFMETFNILLLFQDDLIKLLPDLYTSFDNFAEDLQSIERESVFTELGN